MQETIVAVNDMTELSDAQKTSVYNLYKKYEDVMAAWLGDKNQIATWAPVA